MNTQSNSAPLRQEPKAWQQELGEFLDGYFYRENYDSLAVIVKEMQKDLAVPERMSTFKGSFAAMMQDPTMSYGEKVETFTKGYLGHFESNDMAKAALVDFYKSITGENWSAQLEPDQKFLQEILASFSGDLFESWEKTGADERRILENAGLLKIFEQSFNTMMHDRSMTYAQKVWRYALGGFDHATNSEETSRQFLLNAWEAVTGELWKEDR